MLDYLIDFDATPWESPMRGVRQKSIVRYGQRVRLVELSDEFVEPDWCTKGHVGYVLEGSLRIAFGGGVQEFVAGQGLFIPEGDSHRHKAQIPLGKTALLILIENV